MNMNSKNKNEAIVRQFEKLLAFKTEDEKLSFEATKIHLDFMALLSDVMEEHGISRSELSLKLGTSPSYVTQLFNGDKLVNLVFVAKIQRIFKIGFSLIPSKVDSFGKTFREDLRKRGYQSYRVSAHPELDEKCFKRAS
jgi:transcriptional regulator with XRE-family HTH domain